MRYQTIYIKNLRLRWYRLVEAKKRPVKEVCQLYGIPRKTYYKWYRLDQGLGSVTYRNRPIQRTTKLTSEIKSFIEKTKKKTNYGPLKMKMAVKREFNLDISTTVIYRFYKKRYLIRRPQKKLPWYTPMKKRLVITNKGEGVQMDVKYVYLNIKRQYQFSVLDPYSRLYHFSILDTRESKNAITAFQEAEKYFGFPIHSIQTDNGSEFRGDFHHWLTRNNLTHYFIPKSSPNWNPHVERVHKTIDDEYYLNPYRVWKTPAEWLAYYNEERIHQSLGGLTPREKVAQSVTP